MNKSIIALTLSFFAIFPMMAQDCNSTSDEMVTITIPKSIYSLYIPEKDGGMSESDRESYSRSEENLELYPVHADAQRHEGVPQGKVIKGVFENSAVYSGVKHKYAIYVPVQYDGSQPANLIVFQDGASYLSLDYAVDVPIVLDNLIAKKDIPVTIALFVWPGDKGPGLPIWGGDNNRSIEYDSVDDRFAKFLIDELIAGVLGEYNLSKNPADNCIYGISSSGNSAFTVAWHRNDRFGCVLSSSGTFANIRGGHIWPYVIRNHEKRNIKIFLTVGELECNVVFGDLLIANRVMVGSLDYSGYDFMYTEHKCGHTDKVWRQLLPDVLRWMWSGKAFTPKHCTVILPTK